MKNLTVSENIVKKGLEILEEMREQHTRTETQYITIVVRDLLIANIEMSEAQRSGVIQTAMIDGIFETLTNISGFIAALTVERIEEEGKISFVIQDGQQRLIAITAIVNYLQSKLEEVAATPEAVHQQAIYYAQLQQVLDFELTLCVIKRGSNLSSGRLFTTLNTNNAMSQAQKNRGEWITQVIQVNQFIKNFKVNGLTIADSVLSKKEKGVVQIEVATRIDDILSAFTLQAFSGVVSNNFTEVSKNLIAIKEESLGAGEVETIQDKLTTALTTLLEFIQLAERRYIPTIPKGDTGTQKNKLYRPISQPRLLIPVFSAIWENLSNEYEDTITADSLYNCISSFYTPDTGNIDIDKLKRKVSARYADGRYKTDKNGKIQKVALPLEYWTDKKAANTSAAHTSRADYIRRLTVEMLENTSNKPVSPEASTEEVNDLITGLFGNVEEVEEVASV